MDFLIAIPSYNRSLGIQNKTLRFLNEHGIANERIYIFVNTNEQKEEYEESIPKYLYGFIIVTNQEKGIKNVRNFITDYFPLNQKYVSMDDDIISISELCNGKLREVEDLNAFIERGFSLCEMNGYNLWGIYPTANAFYMKSKDEHSEDLRFIVGSFQGIINQKRHVTLDFKEDYELSILSYMEDGGLIRFNHICINHSLYLKNGGIGLSQLERFNDNKLASIYLLDRYPEYVRLNKRRDGEILLNKMNKNI